MQKSNLSKIKRKNLDEEKYNRCLQNAINYKVYAEIWYLDIVTEGKWYCLVYGNYEAIMPVPYQYFLFLKFVTLPPFCQQLGIFYTTTISNNNFNDFINYLKSRRVRGYTFNNHNVKTFPFIGEKRKNHILNLQVTPAVNIQNFSKDRKRDLKKNCTLDSEIKVSRNIEDFISMIKEGYSYAQKEKYFQILKSIINATYANEKGLLLAYYQNNISCNYRLIIKTKETFIILASARKKEKKYNGTSTAIITHLIENNKGNIPFLDFEGSDLEGVAAFNESLGAIPEYYTFYKNSFFHDYATKIYKNIASS